MSKKDNWAEGTVQANGITLHYFRTGGHGPQVVLIHGITDSGLCWSPVARRLAPDFDLVMYDARGHGRSEAPASGYTLADYAADLAGLTDALGLDQPALLGHSLGAATAALAAADNPGMFRRVALEDPPWAAASTAPLAEHTTWLDEWRARVIENKQKSREELLEINREQSPRWSEEEREPWAEAKQQIDPVVFSGAASVGVGWHEIVPRIISPILLITGDTDEGAVVSQPIAETLHSLNPALQVAHIPGTGHNIRREGLDAYLEVVKPFLKG